MSAATIKARRVAAGTVQDVRTFLLREALQRDAEAKAAMKMIVSGQFRRMFWLGALLAGNAVPFALLVAGGSTFVAVAGVLVLIGIYLTEHIWIRAPQLIPLS